MLPTLADKIRIYALSLLGAPYVLGNEPWFDIGYEPSSNAVASDCSGLVFGVLRRAKVKWKDGSDWPRLVADGYYKNSISVTRDQLRPGDVACFVGSSGRCYHIALVIDHNTTVEARGRRWGVVIYPLEDAGNGVLARHAKLRRFSWLDPGALTPYISGRTLTPGICGDDVKWVQAQLNVPPTGKLDMVTVEAVKRFQAMHQLEVDGIVGRITWAYLLDHAKDVEIQPKPTSTRRLLKLTSPYMRGDDVRAVQAILYCHPYDGIYGPKTAEAVRRFQRAHGLVADGIVGPKTWAALDAVVAKQKRGEK